VDGVAQGGANIAFWEISTISCTKMS